MNKIGQVRWSKFSAPFQDYGLVYLLLIYTFASLCTYLILWPFLAVIECICCCALINRHLALSNLKEKVWPEVKVLQQSLLKKKQNKTSKTTTKASIKKQGCKSSQPEQVK